MLEITMEQSTIDAGAEAAHYLGMMFEFASGDTEQVISQNDIPLAVKHFAMLRDAVNDLAAKVSSLQKIVDALSYELLPTMFVNQDVQTINVTGVGRATTNVRWSASMPDKQRGMQWLRETGNEGLIITTVNAQTLGAFAKTEALAGRPLPNDAFKVTAKSYISVTG
jgi:hypothetical protein